MELLTAQTIVTRDLVTVTNLQDVRGNMLEKTVDSAMMPLVFMGPFQYATVSVLQKNPINCNIVFLVLTLISPFDCSPCGCQMSKAESKWITAC